MSRAWRWALVVLGACLCIAIAGWSWRLATQPVTLKLAVGPSNFTDAEFADAFARILGANQARVRLSIVHTSGPVESIAKLTARVVQLAISRTDLKLGERARAVARLHSDPVVLIATTRSGATKLADLNGDRLGIIGPPDADKDLLDTLRRQYRIALEPVSVQAVPAAIAAALRAEKLSGLLFVVPLARNSKVAETWQAVRKASGMSFRFIPIDQAEAIIASAPAYGEGEINAGQFGASPALPAEDVTTLEVSTDLIADRDVPDAEIMELTRLLFENRQKIAAESAVAPFIKAASTDKDAAIPVHPGAKTYYAGEEETFVEKYGDWVYIGPILFGFIASALMALVRFLGISVFARDPPLLAKVPEVIQAINAAQSAEELDSIRARVDAAVERMSQDAVEGRLTQQDTGAIAIAIAHIDRLLRDRHEQLMRSDRDAEASSARSFSAAVRRPAG